MSEENKISKPTVAILTNFQEFNPGYSLTGIVVDQAQMLARHGHKVRIYVNENFNPEYNDDSGLTAILKRFPDDQITIAQKTAFAHLRDYSTDEMTKDHFNISQKAGQIFADDFIKHKVDIAFTHDFVFTGWNLPYYHALIETNRLLGIYQENVNWYHWIHSVPVPQYRKPWWDLGPLGYNHFLVFPNRTEIMRVAESWLTTVNRVKVIPHIKDIRTWYDFGEDSMKLIDLCPNIMKSHITQVYPCSTDRLSAKQLDIVIKIFANLKKLAKVPVFLVIANQWATGRQPKENVKKYTEMATSLGLNEIEDFVFTSELSEKWETGISKRMIRELQLLSNVFIFPTREESFGLVGPEASFSGALPIVNRSLSMMSEVMSPVAPAFEFGSFHHSHEITNEENYMRAVSLAILNRIQSSEATMVKNYTRIRYNMDSLYYQSYLPIIG